MMILFVTSIFSFLALAWAAISMSRHVRRNAGSRPLDTSPNPLLERVDSTKSQTPGYRAEAGVSH